MRRHRIVGIAAMEPRGHRARSPWPLSLGAAGLVTNLLIGGAGPAVAGFPVPSPANSTCSSCIVLDLCAEANYTVVVRTWLNEPLINSIVDLDFRNVPGVTIDPLSDPDGDGVVSAATGAGGQASFFVRGSGVNLEGLANVEVVADGVLLCRAYPRCYDLSGNRLVDQADVDAWALLPDTSLAGDFDCDGDKDAADLALLQDRVLNQWCPGTLAVDGDGAVTPGLSVFCAPNPARSEVAFRLRANGDGLARLVIYDLSGREVRHFDLGAMPAAERAITWDRRSDTGAPVQPGTYFYRFQVGDRLTARRVVLLQ